MEMYVRTSITNGARIPAMIAQTDIYIVSGAVHMHTLSHTTLMKTTLRYGLAQGRKSEADNGGDIMFFSSHRRQPIVAQLPKKLMSGGGGTKLKQILLKILFFRRKIVLPQKRGGGGDIWYCVPHLQNRGISAHGLAGAKANRTMLWWTLECKPEPCPSSMQRVAHKGRVQSTPKRVPRWSALIWFSQEHLNAHKANHSGTVRLSTARQSIQLSPLEFHFQDSIHISAQLGIWESERETPDGSYNLTLGGT